MIDITLIQGAISGLKTAGDIANSFLHLKSLSEVQGKVIELQSTILSAQQSALAAQSHQSSMIQRISDLEKEISDVKAWEETKQKYRLISPWHGVFTYALKKQSSTTEPAHWLCQKCYHDGVTSILQNTIKPVGHESKSFFDCHRCDSKLIVSGISPEITYAEA